MPGMVVSRYRVDRLLGHGGMGEVFAATDVRLARPVALKFCLAAAEDTRAKQDLEREARAASQLNHPNIATIYDYEEDQNGRPFLVMELLEGTTLADRMRAGPMPMAEVLRTGAGVAAALEEAHRHGILHRDIKPSNIFLTTQGQVKVLDFGLARHWSPEKTETPDDPDETRTALVRGTPAYMSPEQACGDPLDERSDLFSLGTVLYECLTGERPFAGATPTATLRQVLHKTPSDPGPQSGVSANLRRLVISLLEKNPQRRPANATEVREALDAELETGVRRNRAAALPTWPWWRWAAACAVVAALALLLPWIAGSLRRDRLPASARHWYVDGVRALQDGTFLKAARMLEEAVRVAPAYAPARARLADALLESDHVERARQQALAAAPAGDSLDSLTREERRIVTGIHHLVAGRYKESEQEFLRLAKETESGGSASAWFDLGRVRERAGKRKEAVEAYEKALATDPALAPAHVRLARMAVRSGDYPRAEKAFTEANRLYKAANNLEGETEVECQRAQMAVRREDWPEADRAISRALELARLTGNVQQAVFAYSQRVMAQSRTGSLNEARSTAEASVAAARKDGGAILESKALMDLGGVLSSLGVYQESESTLLRAINLARESGDHRTEARGRASLAVVYQLEARFEEAAGALMPALQYYRSENSQLEIIQMQTLVARLKRSAGAFDEAFALFEEVQKEARRANNFSAAAAAAHGMASTRLNQERYRESVDRYAEAAADARKAGDPANEGYALCGQADALRNLGHWREAAAAAGRGIAIATQGKNDRLLTTCLQSAALANAEGGRNQAAAVLFKQAKEASLRRNAKSDKISTIATEALLESRANRAAKAAELCMANFTGDPRRGFQWASGQLACGLYLQQAGQSQQASTIGVSVAEVFAAHGMRSSHWMALALAEVGSQPAGRAAAAKKQFEASLTDRDLAAYRTRPEVVRLSRTLRN